MVVNRPIFYIIPPSCPYLGSMEQLFEKRFKLVTLLISAYKLDVRLKFTKSELSNELDLKLYHASDFIELLKVSSLNKESFAHTIIISDLDEYGLGYDCDITPTTYSYCLSITGATLKAVKILVAHQIYNKDNNINPPICINWLGGWHHAKRSSASGYCFVNDIVIAITELKKFYTKILYIDLDLHHGDGVEEAFASILNTSIMTVSFHHYSPGFFPGTGGLTIDNTLSRYNINIPLNEGIGNASYFYIFQVVMNMLLCSPKMFKPFFAPSVIVIQCGADTLITDPHAKFNLTSKGITACIDYITKICPNTPLLLLGGGGYNIIDTAKCWTQITASICDIPLSPDIPEHLFFPLYGPSYELEISPGLMRDQNCTSYLDEIILSILTKIA